MHDLRGNGLTPEKLELAFKFWIWASILFVAATVATIWIASRTAWAVVPSMGWGAVTVNAIRHTVALGKNYFVVRRAMAKHWYAPWTDSMIDDSFPSAVLIFLRRRGDAENIICFEKDSDFVKFRLMY